MQSYMATYEHFLLKAHKETKVPHNPGPQYNDPPHRISNSIMHNRNTVCNCLQIPSESSLTISKLPANYSSGSTLSKLAY